VDGHPGIEEAIAAAGGVSRLGAALGLAHTSILKWRRSGIPAERVPAVEAATGVPRQRLRPDLFAVSAPYEAEAAALGLDAAALAEQAVRAAISAEKARRWLEENREAISDWNRWTAENELPLAKYRVF
jgi:post-segregation antitoxin (ccd killing protein)